MRTQLLLASVVGALSVTAASAQVNNRDLGQKAMKYFGADAKAVQVLAKGQELDLSIPSESRLYQSIQSALNIYQIVSMDVTRSDLTASEASEFDLAQSFLAAVPCKIAVIGVGAEDLSSNIGLQTASIGYTEFQAQAAEIVASVGENETSAKMISELANYSSLAANSLVTCDIELTSSYCCEDNSSGVGQHCKANTTTTDKCGTFLRNGTSVCRIGSTTC